MRMHMLRVISIDSLFADDDNHMSSAANDAKNAPPVLSSAKNEAVATKPLVDQYAAFWLGGYAGI